MIARRLLLLALVAICLGNCADAPRPSPEGQPVETPDACKAIIARGGSC